MNQTVTLYTLNIYSDICQLFLNKNLFEKRMLSTLKTAQIKALKHNFPDLQLSKFCTGSNESKDA